MYVHPLYHLVSGQESLGPFTVETLASRVQSGESLLTDLCWTAGMQDWKPLGEVLPELHSVAPVPPPHPVPPIPNRAITVAPPSHPAPLLGYYVSKERLWFFNMATFGLYSAYWRYKNWQYVSGEQGFSVSSALKALFVILYGHSLYKRLHNDPKLNGFAVPRFNPGGLYFGSILVFIFGWIISQAPANNVIVTLFWLVLIGALEAWIQSPMQAFIEDVHRKAGLPLKDPTLASAGQMLLILIAALFWYSEWFGAE